MQAQPWPSSFETPALRAPQDEELGCLCRSRLPRVEHGLRPFGRALLRQIVTGAGEHAALEKTFELARVVRGAGIDAIAVAVDRDRGNADLRLRGELRLDARIGRIALDQRVAVAIGVDHDIDEIRIVERGCALLES